MTWWLERLTPDQEVKARALNAVIVSIVLLGSMTLKHVSPQTPWESMSWFLWQHWIILFESLVQEHNTVSLFWGIIIDLLPYRRVWFSTTNLKKYSGRKRHSNLLCCESDEWADVPGSLNELHDQLIGWFLHWASSAKKIDKLKLPVVVCIQP